MDEMRQNDSIKKKTKMLSPRRLKINLALVSISFLLNMGAYFSLEGLQSSLNGDAGTHSLSALYSAYVVMSLFLPSLALNFMQSRTAIGVATLAYATYTIANFYPRSYTLIPAATILGTGSSILWSSKRVYVSDLAFAYAKQTKSDKDKMTSKFFGIFWSIFSLSMLIGNAASSVTIQLFGITDVTTSNTSGMNSTSHVAYTTPENRTNGPTEPAMHSTAPNQINSKVNRTAGLRCGMHNCDADVESTPNSEGDKTMVNLLVLYILFGVFVAIQLGAALIMFLLADDAPKREMHIPERKYGKKASHTEKTVTEDTKSEKDSPCNRQELNSGDIVNDEEENDEKESNTSRSKIKQQSVNDDCIADDAESGTDGIPSNEGGTTARRVKKKILATGKFIIINHTAKLLIPITIHVGVLQAFLFGQFTKYWVTCALGIQYVGYVAAVFGFGSAVGGYAVGLLTQRIRRWVVMLAALFLELAMGACLYLWEPEIIDYIWLFFLASWMCGILHATHKTILTTVYSIFFPDDQEAASASFAVWDPLGTAVAYAISSQVCNLAFLIAMVCLDVVGTLLYIQTEHAYAKQRQKRIEEQDNADNKDNESVTSL